MHVLILADTDEQLEKAGQLVSDLVYDPAKRNAVKQDQLRRVAELNGNAHDGTATRSVSRLSHDLRMDYVVSAICGLCSQQIDRFPQACTTSECCRIIRQRPTSSIVAEAAVRQVQPVAPPRRSQSLVIASVC